METLRQDVRYGLRMLVKRPGFTLVAMLALALGVGATTAIFSVVNAVLLRPLPFPDSDRLMWIGQQFAGEQQAAGEPKFLFWREHSQSFEAMAAYQELGSGANLAGGDEPEYVDGLRVSVDFFRVLGVQPAAGRTFTEAEDAPGGDAVVILSDGLWRRRFAADAALLGQTIALNGKPVTVVGILPPQFRMGWAVDIFVPMRAVPTANHDPNDEVVGRLKSGITLAEAQAEMQGIAESYRAAHPEQMRANESIGVKPYRELFSMRIRPLLWILLGAVGFLLLIACTNVANLQLTRAAARQKEMAVRKALGAGAGRIARQLLTEGVMLALAGGALGLLIALWGTDLLVAAMPDYTLSRLQTISFDWRVLGFTFSTAVLTGILFGLAPAIQAARLDVNTALKEGGNKGGSAARGRLRDGLVVAEVALAMVLLVGAMLLGRTFFNLRSVEPGFDPAGVLTFQVALNGDRYHTSAQTAAFYRDALEHLGRVPGVEAAAVTTTLPLNAQFNMPIFFSDQPDQARSVQFRIISPDYFRVMKIPVQQGRAFSETDNAAAPPVALVNEAFVRRHLGDKNVFEQQLMVGRTVDRFRQIVGVVGDQKQYDLASPAPPTVFLPIPQVSDKLLAAVRHFVSSYFTVRTTGEPLALGETMKREIAALDPQLPLSEMRPMARIVERSTAPQQFNMLLIGVFAGVGLLLAAVGIYGVISYSVAQRTNEIGIRMALGAQTRNVVGLILRHGLRLALAGLAIGMAGAFALTRLMRSLLFGVSATDPLTFALVALLLTAVALVACYVPARRATKIDPMIALRYE